MGLKITLFLYFLITYAQDSRATTICFDICIIENYYIEYIEYGIL